MTLHAALHYVPLDRQHSLARNAALPTYTRGSVLYADISGFTPLTEMMVEVHGARRGAEMLTHYLDTLYETLISQVMRYGGSVISFSGDAITCWFDGDNAAHPAVTAAWIMHETVNDLEEIRLSGRDPVKLGVKIAIASGGVRRFLVGDPRIQVIEVLAGETISHLHRGVKRAKRGQVLIDSTTLQQLGSHIAVENLDEGYGLVTAITLRAVPIARETVALHVDQVRSWLLPEVYDRLQEGLGEFLTELRPVVALFAKFAGINFDETDAGKQLDQYVHEVQRILERYQGRLIQLTIDDKGSYFYAAFGAPVAHEDDPQRATAAALELRQPPFNFIQSVQIGISQGMMRVGAYGSSQARTYGVLGDEVNLAARLMEHAAAGEVIASERVHKATDYTFVWTPLDAISVKGKREPVNIGRLVNERQVDTTEMVGASRATYVVGRAEQLGQAVRWLQPVNMGRSPGLLHISGELGMGKTHMLQVIRESGDYPHWWICPPDSILRRSLHPFVTLFKNVFKQNALNTRSANRAYFDDQMTRLIASVPRMRPELEHAASFIGALLDLEWENSPYQLTTPKDRFTQTLKACVTVLRAFSQRHPIILQIEDAQVLDADSLELISRLVEDGADYPLALIVTSRLPVFPLASMQITLTRISAEAVAELAAHLLNGEVDANVSDFLETKTGGNPFFVEQLVFSLLESGAVLKAADGYWRLQPQKMMDVPDSINGMLVARLDRLKPYIKAVVQTAAVVGTEFSLAILAAILGDEVADSIAAAEKEGIWQRVSLMTFRFEHSLMCDAAYEMQLSSRLREQHAVVGSALERLHPDSFADLAYHFGRAGNVEKERHYARLAGNHAASRFANREAIAYFTRALEITDSLREQFELIRLRESVYDVQGAREQQTHDLEQMRARAEQLADDHLWAQYALRSANYAENTGAYDEAVKAGQSVVETARRIGADDIEIEGYLIQGRACGWQARYIDAREHLEKSLALAEQAGLAWQMANSLRNLGIVAFAQGDYEEAHDLQTRALNLCREIGDRRGESMALNSLAVIAKEQRRLQDAQSYQDMALKLSLEIGDKRMQASIGAQMMSDIVQREPYSTRITLQDQMLALNRQIKNRRGECSALQNLATIAVECGATDDAYQYYQQSLDVANEIGYRQGTVKTLLGLAWMHGWLEDYTPMLTYGQQAHALASEIDSKPQITHAHLIIGQAFAGLKQTQEALSAYETAERLCRELKRHELLPEVLSGLASLNLQLGLLSQAQRYAKETLDTLQSSVGWDTLKIYWMAFQVYQASNWANTLELLELAHALLHERAALIDVDSLRQAFLDIYPLHRELIAARAWALHQ